jgi:hypothetical protein
MGKGKNTNAKNLKKFFFSVERKVYVKKNLKHKCKNFEAIIGACAVAARARLGGACTPNRQTVDLNKEI